MSSTVEMSPNRRQPVRSTRINSTRMANGIREDIEEQVKPGFFPGITHFTDTMDSMPKEMIRHSTMLKEVDAKLWAPEQEMKTFLRTEAPQYNPQEPLRESQAQRYYESGCNIMASMLGSLDEKNHVLSTANEALEKLLGRCESAWPLIEQEISESTRWGRLDHWAYTDRSADKKPTANTERASRRNNEAEKAAAAMVADISNPKNLKGNRRIGHDAADADDGGKRSGQTKRKPNDNSAANGLGINGATVKRRKVEKPSAVNTNGGYAMEKSLSSVFRNIPGSPTTSTADSKKKGKNGNATNGRRRAGTATSNADSPMMASSPVMGHFALPGKGANSPANGAPMARTVSSRARGGPTSNPTQSNRPPSAASTPLMNGMSYPDERHPMSRTSSGFKGEETQYGDYESKSTLRAGIKREDTNAKHRPPSISTGTRNNGKASKANTPVLGTFQDSSRPKSGRNSTTALNNDFLPPKRSHKKKEPVPLQRQRSTQKTGRARDEDDSDEAEEAEETEQLYCYCNGPSHGEMVACDMPGCEKEWFHLDCVGLTKPPPPKSKWFCPDCSPKQQRMMTERMAVAR